MTTGDIAILLSVSSQTVINWMESGQIKFTRINKGVRRAQIQEVYKFILDNGVHEDDLDKFMFTRMKDVLERDKFECKHVLHRTDGLVTIMNKYCPECGEVLK